ncbi:MAG: MFS transporter [Planctomycetes bacterium]|nr:MFS transporter [Planctomycetota bacterium]
MTGPDTMARAWWGVLVLMLFYVLAFVDRQVLALLVQPIRDDLGLSLTEFGLLHGLSFALFYTLLGIPLARLADTGSRRGLVAIGVAAWSAMTVLCGKASSFAQLFLARVGVGVGEAALSPAAYSWIADSFPRERRATAISVYSAGIYLGSGLAFVLGGQVVVFAQAQNSVDWPVFGALRAWQVPLVLAGLAGLVLAPLAWTLREPTRARANERTGTPPIAELARWIAKHPRAFLAHHGGFALLSLSGYAVNSWSVYLLERHFAMTKSAASASYGLVLGLGGAFGILLGGWIADRARARGVLDANLRVGAIAALAAAPFALAFPLAGSSTLAIALLVPLSIATAAGFGVAAAGVVELVPPALRGRASAVYLFVINAIGLGVGPTLVGVLTDHVFGGESAFPLSLALVGGLSAFAACALLALGARGYRACIEGLGVG